MVLFAVVDVSIFLIFGWLAPGAHLSDEHGFLLTSTSSIEHFFVNSSTALAGEHYMECTTKFCTRFPISSYLTIRRLPPLRERHAREPRRDAEAARRASVLPPVWTGDKCATVSDLSLTTSWLGTYATTGGVNDARKGRSAL
jgi:hypothetical protein